MNEPNNEKKTCGQKLGYLLRFASASRRLISPVCVDGPVYFPAVWVGGPMANMFRCVSTACGYAPPGSVCGSMATFIRFQSAIGYYFPLSCVAGPAAAVSGLRRRAGGYISPECVGAPVAARLRFAPPAHRWLCASGKRRGAGGYCPPCYGAAGRRAGGGFFSV